MPRSALSAFVVFVAIGCAPAGTPDRPNTSFEALVESMAEGEPTDEGAYRRVLDLTVPTLVPGTPATFEVTGANPGEIIVVARSQAGPGSGPCLGSAQLACLGILSPSLLSSSNADATGLASFTVNLPATLPLGAPVSFQAVAPRGGSGASWVMSQVVETATANADLHVGNMAAGDLVITEIMQNPASVADAAGEWFEVWNASGLDANLDGLEVTDFALDTFTVSAPVLLPAGERVVFGRSADPALNGGAPVDIETGAAITLANGTDELHLVANALIVDSVAWDNGATFPDPNGASMELGSAFLDATANDAGVNWSEATIPYGLGDLGTPGDGGPVVCDPATEVEHDGRCYYLDGSGGTCLPGYELAPQSVLFDIHLDFVGLNHRTAPHGNCCIWHADIDTELQDWGMEIDCGSAGPFFQGPVLGGTGCTDANNRDYDQLTLCRSL